MKNIYVIRHGETNFNKNGKYLGRTDMSLNQTGIVQAKQLADKVSDLNIDIIYCSPLKRAIETAEFIKSEHRCEIFIDDHFIERSVGVYEGLTKDEVKNKYPDLYVRNITRIFNEAPPNGETINEVIKRVFSGLDEIRKLNKFSNIMIITHAFVGKAINKYFNPKMVEQDFFNFSLDNTEIKKYTLNSITK